MIIVNILILLLLIGLVTFCVWAVIADIYRSRIEHRDVIKKFYRDQLIEKCKGRRQ